MSETKSMQKIENFSGSDAYRARIHQLIPGGAHTYSKGDDQFPQRAPAAIVRGKGAYVWDPDGNRFLDCSMGLTSVSLGHAYEPVLERVREELDKGVNFQRPSVIEAEFAEMFLGIVPGHDRIKFAKNGSTVTTAAVKLARAHTGRDLVAFPLDHPFYSYDDWFIASTPCNKGIPESIANLSVTYQSDNLESLKALFEKYPGRIACVISEPEKLTPPAADYIRQAIELAHSEGALYILDEMVTGYKTAFPGSIAKYNVQPDMACWGKGIANGFSMCCLTGNAEVMDLGGITNVGEEKVFLISSTHGGETHAIGAAIATLQEFRDKDVVTQNLATALKVKELTRAHLARRGMEAHIEMTEADWLPAWVFKNRAGEVDAGMRTLFMQEMISWGVLFQGIFVASYSHREAETAHFAEAFDRSLEVYARALEDGYEKYLTGEPAKPVFRKYL